MTRMSYLLLILGATSSYASFNNPQKKECLNAKKARVLFTNDYQYSSFTDVYFLVGDKVLPLRLNKTGSFFKGHIYKLKFTPQGSVCGVQYFSHLPRMEK